MVISIIALLISLLLPALRQARSSAHSAVCMSNLRQTAIGLALYSQDDKQDRLPPIKIDAYTPWMETIYPYMNQPIKYGVGEHYLRCPAIPPSSYTDLDTPDWFNTAPVGNWYRTYGANYPIIMAYPTGEIPGHDAGAVLGLIPNNVYMIADGGGRNWGAGDINDWGRIFGPKGWFFNLDYDGDGVPDSYSDFVSTNTYGPYNGLNPVHNGAANFQFSDGHVATVTTRAWASNENQMWGADDYYGSYR